MLQGDLGDRRQGSPVMPGGTLDMKAVLAPSTGLLDEHRTRPLPGLGVVLLFLQACPALAGHPFTQGPDHPFPVKGAAELCLLLS